VTATKVRSAFITDRVVREDKGIGIASVRPSVCFHSIFWTDWLWTGVNLCVGYDHN